MYAGLELITKWAAETAKSNSASQLNIFGETDAESTLKKIELPKATQDKKQELTWEKELLGLYLSDHPLKEYSELLGNVAVTIDSLDISEPNKTVRIGGVIQEVKKITTKNNQMMAFAQFEDLSGMVELVIFPNTFKDSQKFWETDQMLLVEGKTNDKDGSLKILVDRAWPLDMVNPTMLPKLRSMQPTNGSWQKSSGEELAKPSSKKEDKIFSVELPYRTTKTLMSQLKDILQSHPGNTPVELRILNNGDTKIMRTKLTVKQTPELEEEIEQVLSGV